MGKRVVVDTAVVTQMAGELRTLSSGFEVDNKSPELNKSVGVSVVQLKNMYKTIYETKQNVKELLDKSIEFLDRFSEATDLSDRQNASAVNNGSRGGGGSSGGTGASRSW